jgi:hypothetical protein
MHNLILRRKNTSADSAWLLGISRKPAARLAKQIGLDTQIGLATHIGLAAKIGLVAN